MDRSWMYRKVVNGRVPEEFYKGLEEFFTQAKNLPEGQQYGITKCPCRKAKCQNMSYLPIDTVKSHLLKHGFVNDYTVWNHHGEQDLSSAPVLAQYGGIIERGGNEGFGGGYTAEPYNQCAQMVMDGGGHQFFRDVSGLEVPVSCSDGAVRMDELPNRNAQNFYNMLESTNRPIWEGSTHSQMSVTSRMMGIKSEHKMSERCFDDVSGLMKETMSSDNCLAKDFYETKKFMKALGLPVERIDCCDKGCMIYWGVDENRLSCKVCNEARYIPGSNNIPQKEMFYFPIAPRLQRLYASEAMASHMRWHDEHRREDGVMIHPSDSEAWKQLSVKHPDFAFESRNVRLGLCTDGFAPFGQYGRKYSSWPVILTPYNLPPWLCMKEQFMFLTVIVPGKDNPKHKIDVFLQPLIAELMELWNHGVVTYDASRHENFTMKVCLLWTISDFPAYSMLSGWSTAGKYACPHCLEWSEAFYLQNGKKMSWFDSHRRCLPEEHSYRKDKTSFIIGHEEDGYAPPYLGGEDILDQINNLGLVKVTDDNAMAVNESIYKNNEGCGWRKRSIFWDLPYWKDLLIRHNLDVMHIEKNVFDNVFHTVMEMDNTKDNCRARDDLELWCCRPELHKMPNGRYPKASFVLDKDKKRCLCKWLTEILFPDGCASNISRRCVDMQQLRVHSMKSHDCHVFMQRLLPVAFRYLLPDKVWTALTELSLFFRSITCATLTVSDMTRLEEEIPIILCNLERIFPPSFFDSMEHLPLHLPYEARIAGPVQYRWMYPFERLLKKIKGFIGNAAKVEASIMSSYLQTEVRFFAQHYFPQSPTNEDGITPEASSSGISSIFCDPGRTHGKCTTRYLTDAEYHAAHRTVMMNCDEFIPYIELYRQKLRTTHPYVTEEQVEEYVDKHFPKWLRSRQRDKHGIEDTVVRDLSYGPSLEVNTYHTYFVNGYKFQSPSSSIRATASNGVCVKGSSSTTDCDYYGLLKEVIIMEYPSNPVKKVVLFNCDWFDPTPDVGTRVHPVYDIVDVNITRSYQGRFDPFILAQQAQQVCYLPYPSRRSSTQNWVNVSKVKAKGLTMPNRIDEPVGTTKVAPVAFQDEEAISHGILTVYDDPELVGPLHDLRGGFIDIMIGDVEVVEVEDDEYTSDEDYVQ